MSHLGRPVLSPSLKPEPRRRDAPALSGGTAWGFGICLGLGLVCWLWAFSNLARPLLPILFAAGFLVVVGIGWCVLVVVTLVRK